MVSVAEGRSNRHFILRPEKKFLKLRWLQPGVMIPFTAALALDEVTKKF
jgi:hypothetical protein